MSPQLSRRRAGPILGSHMSIAGGYYKAIDAGQKVGCDCVQIFTKNNNQWRAKPMTDDDATAFQDALKRTGITHPLSHASYLINLASPEAALWKRSIDAMVIELQRATQLGIPYVVVHPGAFKDTSEARGLRRIIKGLDEVHRQIPIGSAKCLLETTAGQGTNLGWRFEQLAEMINGIQDPDRAGVCFDTCHVFAAGYPLASEDEYQSTMGGFHKIVGRSRIKAFHLNDSLKPLGSRVDRHAHIGRGEMGLKPFRHLLNDRRFRKIPMYLETAKGQEDDVDLDVINLKRLRRLVRRSSAA